MRVDAECRGGIRVSKTAAYRPHVLATHEHARSGEMTQIVQTYVESKVIADPSEGERHIVGSPRGAIGNVTREHIRGVVPGYASNSGL